MWRSASRQITFSIKGAETTSVYLILHSQHRETAGVWDFHHSCYKGVNLLQIVFWMYTVYVSRTF